MLYFTPPSVRPVQEAMAAGRLGAIITPAQGNRLPDGVRWCADNGCFGRGYPGDARWLEWLGRRAHAADRCAFAVAPDVVGDAAATLERSRPFLRQIRALGFPAALAAQDGLERLQVPWEEFDVLFIGGSTRWKLGAAAAGLASAARAAGRPVHMGRVNSLRRIRHAASAGAVSADGTFVTYGPDIRLPELLGWLDALEADRCSYGSHGGELDAVVSEAYR